MSAKVTRHKLDDEMKCVDKCVETGIKVTNLFMRNDVAPKDAKTEDDFISYHNQLTGQMVSIFC